MSDARQPGSPTWLDLWSADIDRDVEFFVAVLGWTATPGTAESGGWRLGESDGAAVTGFGPALPGAAGDSFALYLAVEDAKESFNIACGLGARPALGPDQQIVTVPGSGIMSTLFDPDDNLIALWQAAPRHGFEATDRDGAPTWYELRTRDAAAARNFYAEVFGLTFSDPLPPDPGFEDADYRIALLPDGAGSFGLCKASESAPAGWISYYWTDDLDAADTRVREHGGTADLAPHPFSYGRCADYRTPGGARFGLFQPEPEN